ncbi:urease accessory protein UreF [Maritalea mobilis]|uniref:Urease accessory protein UreF n=1 Tax=[Roseibacterium] beibuensis TaxID=1193142 RepID=A0ABP9LMI3_9RHOB|nr:MULTISPECIES: urease accessory UreF family protein [Alphaproteobacteria]MBY6199933.1 urease accessory protein UreF [Maritalea mobilis]MCS6625883.1 urease accessory protein UreF [Roseibacterium beibuensis]
MTETDLLSLTQWLSPAFPVSAYAYSHGLEAEITHGRVHDGETARDWIATVIEVGAGRNDALILLAVLSGRDADEMADLARALAGSAERWEETRAMGAAFAETVAAMRGGNGVARPYPVAVGMAARALNVPHEVVAALYLQALAASLVSVAVRFVPLGQAEGQRIQAALQPRIAALAGDLARLDAMAVEDHLGAAAFGADLATMEHEGLEVRIFRT